MDLSINGGSYEHYSLATNNQRCINAYITNPGPEGRGKATLISRVGKKLMTTLTGVSTIREMIFLDDVLYVVASNKFFKVTIDYTAHTASFTELGTINNYSGLVSVAANPYQIIIVNGTTSGWLYSPLNYNAVTVGPIGGTAGDTYTLTINGTPIYTAFAVTTALTVVALITKINTLTGTTNITAASGGTGILTLTGIDSTSIVITESGTGFTAGTDGITVSTGPFSTGTANAFAQIIDPDFQGGSCVAFLDGYFFIAVPDSNRFYASQINDGSAYDALDLATAEINNSPIVSLQVKNRQLWIFKKDYIEVWYDAANATGMPLAPRIGSELSIGCIAPASVINIDNTLYWFDSRKFIAMAVDSSAVTSQTTGNAAVSVSTDALNNIFSEYETIDDAVACGYQERGHLMYQITFPTENKTWVYDLTTKTWHERTFYDSTFDVYDPDLAEMAVSNNGLTVVGNRNSSKLYISHPNYFDDAGTDIYCIRSTAQINQDFKYFGIDMLELCCTTGLANSSGSGSDPMISMRYSNDGGYTWSDEQMRSLGQIGEYGKRIIWNRLGSSANWIFEFTIVAPIKWSIVSGSINITEIEV